MRLKLFTLMISFLLLSVSIPIVYCADSTAQTDTTTVKKVRKAPSSRRKNTPIKFNAPAKLEKGKFYWNVQRNTWAKDSSDFKSKNAFMIEKESILTEIAKDEKWLQLEGMTDETTKVKGWIPKSFAKPFPDPPKKSSGSWD